MATKTHFQKKSSANILFFFSHVTTKNMFVKMIDHGSKIKNSYVK